MIFQQLKYLLVECKLFNLKLNSDLMKFNQFFIDQPLVKYCILYKKY